MKSRVEPLLWEWQELLTALQLDGPLAGGGVSGVSIDTRTLAPGDLFIALSGDPDVPGLVPGGRDGHQFVDDAVRAGASAVLVSRRVAQDTPALIVNDTLDGLWALGAAGRARMSGRVVAITGSAGKTTARFWLQSVLEAQAKTHGSVGSYNNHWGVPLSLARMPREAAYGVFEIGMNHAGEIRPLSELVAPQVAIVLNVLPAHIGNLGSLDAIRTEKLSIRAGLPDNGTLICPLELGVPGSFTFSTNREADIWADPNAAGGKDSDDHLAAVHLNGQRYELRMSAGGEHRLQTALAVLAGVYCLGGEVEAAVDTLASLSVPPGRGNRLSIAGRTIIDDSYNANPVSMNYAISALLSEPGRRVLLMGEMLELGDESGDLHRAAAIRSAPVDVVYSFGDHFQRLEGVFGPGYAGHVDSATGFDIDGFAASTLPGDVIVVKGSNRVFWAHGFVDKLCAALKRASRPSLSSPSKP